MHRYTRLLLCLCLPAFCLATLAPVSQGQVIISELMYNPDSSEGYPPRDGQPGEPNRTEWVELYNVDTVEHDLSGWTLKDEDGMTTPIPDGTVLAPGKTLVLIPDFSSPSEFKAAWGEGIDVIALGNWGEGGLVNLANGPSAINEILNLLNAAGDTIDQVNYDDEGDWPADHPDGSSIYVVPDKLYTDQNDLPNAWAPSIAGQHGAKSNEQAGPYQGNDVGSPGYVEDANADSTDTTPANP